jgi:hypothetical protein
MLENGRTVAAQSRLAALKIATKKGQPIARGQVIALTIRLLI